MWSMTISHKETVEIVTKVHGRNDPTPDASQSSQYKKDLQIMCLSFKKTESYPYCWAVSINFEWKEFL